MARLSFRLVWAPPFPADRTGVKLDNSCKTGTSLKDVEALRRQVQEAREAEFCQRMFGALLSLTTESFLS